MDFSGDPTVKNPPAKGGDTGSIPGPGRFPHAVEQLSPAPQLLKPTRPGAHAQQQEREAMAMRSPVHHI